MMETMTSELWDNIRYFKPTDNFGDPFKMNVSLIFALDRLREYVNKPIIIHCGYEERDKKSWHTEGLAVDLHIKGLGLIDQFLAASRFDMFNGIGIYKCWRNPGLHLDNRPHKSKRDFDARWICLEQGKYLAFNSRNFKKLYN